MFVLEIRESVWLGNQTIRCWLPQTLHIQASLPHHTAKELNKKVIAIRKN